MALEDAYWYSSERWYVYVLTDPFLNLHLSTYVRSKIMLRALPFVVVVVLFVAFR